MEVRPRWIALALAATGAALLGACGAGGTHGASAPTATSPTRSKPATTTTTTAPTTTTSSIPPDPQPSAEDASSVFIEAWEDGDRAAAARVATATAAATLFAARYDGETLNNRGCSVPGPNSVVCSWGPYAGASPANPLYEVTVSPHGSAWFVSSVVKLG